MNLSSSFFETWEPHTARDRVSQTPKAVGSANLNPVMFHFTKLNFSSLIATPNRTLHPQGPLTPVPLARPPPSFRRRPRGGCAGIPARSPATRGAGCALTGTATWPAVRGSGPPPRVAERLDRLQAQRRPRRDPHRCWLGLLAPGTPPGPRPPTHCSARPGAQLTARMGGECMLGAQTPTLTGSVGRSPCDDHVCAVSGSRLRSARGLAGTPPSPPPRYLRTDPPRSPPPAGPRRILDSGPPPLLLAWEAPPLLSISFYTLQGAFYCFTLASTFCSAFGHWPVTSLPRRSGRRR